MSAPGFAVLAGVILFLTIALRQKPVYATNDEFCADDVGVSRAMAVNGDRDHVYT